LQPAFNAEQYGEFLVDNNEAWEQFANSTDTANSGLREFVSGLIVCVNHADYGDYIADLEQGKFTEFGYITAQRYDPIQEIYRGAQDIPEEYKVTGFTEPAALKDTLTFSRIDVELARLAVVRGTVDVYRVSDRGAERLASITAVDTRLWESGKYEFAVKREDLPKLETLKAKLDTDLNKSAEREKHIPER
jgi:hypothetical protein